MPAQCSTGALQAGRPVWLVDHRGRRGRHAACARARRWPTSSPSRRDGASAILANCSAPEAMPAALAISPAGGSALRRLCQRVRADHQRRSSRTRPRSTSLSASPRSAARSLCHPRPVLARPRRNHPRRLLRDGTGPYRGNRPPPAVVRPPDHLTRCFILPINSGGPGQSPRRIGVPQARRNPRHHPEDHTMTLPSSARAVIIGGGVIGCSVAYHLTRLGWTDVVLLERKRLTSGTTWHAAGLIAQLRATANMTRLAKYSQELYGSLEAETGIGDRLPAGRLHHRRADRGTARGTAAAPPPWRAPSGSRSRRSAPPRSRRNTRISTRTAWSAGSTCPRTARAIPAISRGRWPRAHGCGARPSPKARRPPPSPATARA